MPDYKSMYLLLFNSITDTIEVLKTAQQRAEKAYVGGITEEPLKIVNSPPDDQNAA